MSIKQSPSQTTSHAVASGDHAELLGRVAVKFFEQRALGKIPSVEDYAKRYPVIAEHIRRTFPALELVDQTASQAGDLGTPVARENERLGDFQIVGELGRGGMGVVYEAEQLSIGRRVALKVLPFATLANPRALARFKNEVRAAATLDHPHIVTVHSVGEERGIHYFAMQLIRGQSLAEVILNLRQIRNGTKATDDSAEDFSNGSDLPLCETRTIAEASTSVPSESGEGFYRRVAELGEQAASALHFAHEQGVIHRDVKPANLMLDRTGKIYVTDFGLARIESDAGVTMTGDLIGTLRYMAPEQALAKRITVDHRVDIYGLGATLYEFATLKPIFEGASRERLLRQVAFEQPTVPSKIARDIPRDLETIIGKSLSKDPLDRYDTAADLALDLRRWLDNKPILGKRSNLLQTAQRWIRRNPTPSIGLFLGLLLAIGALLLGLARANSKAEHQRKLAYGPMVYKGFNEYAEGQLDTVDRILATTIPGAGQKDLRAFEWYLLKELRDDLQPNSRLTFNDRIRELHRSPGGRWLGVLTVRGQLSVVDLKNNYRQTSLKVEPLGTDFVHINGSSWFAFSPDDQYLYSTAHFNSDGENSPLLRFDLNSINPAGFDFSAGTSQPDCYAVSVGPDGRIATLGWDVEYEGGDSGERKRMLTCVTRDPSSGKLLAEANVGGMSLAFSPAGGAIAIADSKNTLVHLLDTDRLAVRHRIPSEGTRGFGTWGAARVVSFSPDSQLLAANSANGVCIWDVSEDEPELLSELQTGNPWVWDIRFLDQNLVATTMENGQVEVWHVSGQNKVDQVKLKVPARGIEFFADTETLVFGGTSDLLFKPFRRSATGPLRGQMHAVGVGGGMAAVVTNENELKVWQPSTMTFDRIANVQDDLPSGQNCGPIVGIQDLSISPNGRALAVTQYCDGGHVISVWSRDGSFLSKFKGGSQAKFTPDGTHVVTSVEQGVLELWDWRASERIATSHAADVPGKTMLAMEFSRGGSWLATGHGAPQTPGAVCVWKVEGDTVRLINRFVRGDGIEDLSFTRDEQWVVAGDATGVQLHNISSGATRPLNTGSVRGVDVTMDGKRLVTAGDTMIRLWGVETGERMGSFDAGGFVKAVRFIDDHRLLYIVKGVGARVLDTDTE